jgi:hypothetical protein
MFDPVRVVGVWIIHPGLRSFHSLTLGFIVGRFQRQTSAVLLFIFFLYLFYQLRGVVSRDKGNTLVVA